jgi:hypothetical protein
MSENQNVDFTYGGDLVNSALDRIRFELGDTSQSKAKFNDNEINGLLSICSGNIYLVCSKLCYILATRTAGLENVRTSDYVTDRSGISKKYLQMAKVFQQRSVGVGAFIMPSMTVTEKEINEENTDLLQPTFKRGLHENHDVVSTIDDQDASSMLFGAVI